MAWLMTEDLNSMWQHDEAQAKAIEVCANMLAHRYDGPVTLFVLATRTTDAVAHGLNAALAAEALVRAMGEEGFELSRSGMDAGEARWT